MNRNQQGMIVYLILTLALSAVITLPIMIGREIYQYKKYLKPCNIGFEWDDVFQYGFVIVFAQVLQIMFLAVLKVI